MESLGKSPSINGTIWRYRAIFEKQQGHLSRSTINTQSQTQLRLELAAVIDVGEHFVKSTYTLEGDGPLVLVCYEEILKLRAVIHYANVNATAANIAPGNPTVQ